MHRQRYAASRVASTDVLLRAVLPCERLPRELHCSSSSAVRAGSTASHAAALAAAALVSEKLEVGAQWAARCDRYGAAACTVLQTAANSARRRAAVSGPRGAKGYGQGREAGFPAPAWRAVRVATSAGAALLAGSLGQVRRGAAGSSLHAAACWGRCCDAGLGGLGQAPCQLGAWDQCSAGRCGRGGAAVCSRCCAAGAAGCRGVQLAGAGALAAQLAGTGPRPWAAACAVLRAAAGAALCRQCALEPAR